KTRGEEPEGQDSPCHIVRVRFGGAKDCPIYRGTRPGRWAAGSAHEGTALLKRRKSSSRAVLSTFCDTAPKGGEGTGIGSLQGKKEAREGCEGMGTGVARGELEWG
ncbi:unnamed protein product, partial [Discosporangium mesarthrocarpum]